MRKTAGKEVGDNIKIPIAYNPAERVTPVRPKLQAAFQANTQAKKIQQPAPIRQKEIACYINGLKTKSSINRNVQRTVEFLLDRQRFVGREQRYSFYSPKNFVLSSPHGLCLF